MDKEEFINCRLRNPYLIFIKSQIENYSRPMTQEELKSFADFSFPLSYGEKSINELKKIIRSLFKGNSLDELKDLGNEYLKCLDDFLLTNIYVSSNYDQTSDYRLIIWVIFSIFYNAPYICYYDKFNDFITKLKSREIL